MFTQPFMLGALAGFASTAHCAAMCGPLAASTCARHAPRAGLVRYQLGRSAGYAFAGGLAGGVGHVFALTALAPWLRYALPVLTAISLLVLASRTLRPSRPLVQLRLRGSRERSLFTSVMRLVPRDPGVVGALTALLPCAALAATLLLAATTQERGAGAVLMLGFSTTTALGVLGGAALLERASKLGGRIAPAVLATALTCAALYVGLRPIYLQWTDPSASHAHAPACH